MAKIFNVTPTFTGPVTAPSFSGTLNVSNLSGTVGVTQGGTGLAVATLGDLHFGSGSNTLSILAGNSSTTRKFLLQVGNGTVSAAPQWVTIASGDVPDLSGTYSLRAGNTSLTTLGTVTAGTWNATAIAVAFGGTGATTASAALANLGALPANDPSVTNARTPTAHATSHGMGGSDPISPSSIGAATAAQGAQAGTAVQPNTTPTFSGGNGSGAYTLFGASMPSHPATAAADLAYFGNSNSTTGFFRAGMAVCEFTGSASAAATSYVGFSATGSTNATSTGSLTGTSSLTSVYDSLIGLKGNAYHLGSGSVLRAAGVSAYVSLNAGTITDATGFESINPSFNGAGTVTNYCGVRVRGSGIGTGTITNRYGVRVESLVGGTNLWAFYAVLDKSFFGGGADFGGQRATGLAAGTTAGDAVTFDQVATWQTLTTAANVLPGSRYLLNAASAAFTVTLPASPAVGVCVELADYAATLGTNNVTVARNGLLIAGSAQDLVLNVAKLHCLLIYQDTTIGWSVRALESVSAGPSNGRLVAPLAPSAGAITPAMGTGGTDVLFNVSTLSANVTVNAPTGTFTDGQMATFRFSEDATGGWTTTWNAVFKFSSASPASSIPTTANGRFYVSCIYVASAGVWDVQGGFNTH